MRIRTFLRIMFNDIFHENIVSRTISSLVKFCYEFSEPIQKELKYNNKMPLSMQDTKKNIFFQSISGDKIDCQ